MQKIYPSDITRTRVYLIPFMLALGIHLIFILFLARIAPEFKPPAQNDPKEPLKAILRINLQKFKPAPEPPVAAPLPHKKVDAPIDNPEKPITAKPETIKVSATTVTNNLEPQKKPEQISTATLRSQLLQVSKKETMPLPLILGSYRPNLIPTNWTHKAVEYTPGIFKAAELPTKAIVLDKWKAADGTQNAKIKLPNGDVICGSRAVQNPIDIYSMPIWMYRSC